MALTRRKASRPSTFSPPARSGVEERNLTWTATLRPGADIVGPFGGLLLGPYGYCRARPPLTSRHLPLWPPLRPPQG